MRLAGKLAVVLLAGAAASIFACQEPTQVTIDVRLATAKCGEVHGTALNVGVHPLDTEEKVKSRFPTAQTTDCDPSLTPPRIGTLVITPNDEERAAIVVVASYGSRNDPTDCQPPDYKDCVVARRQFSFSKHHRLYMPITVDPTCINVPCDAFSTCRKGFCFAAESSPCENDGPDCVEPGETVNGGTNIDASVTPDAPGTTTDGPPPAAICNGGTLSCGGVQCGAAEQCCTTQTGARCLPATESCVRVCCTSNDCGGQQCFTNGVPHGTPDAAVLPDGAVVDEDSGPAIDTGTPPPDGSTQSDGSPQVDGSTTPDASMPPPDSSTPPPDASMPPPDASLPPTDASSPPDGAPAPSLGICQ